MLSILFLALNRIKLCSRPEVPRHRKPVRIIHGLTVHVCCTSVIRLTKSFCNIVELQNICETIHDFYIPERRISSGHDISDGGLITALLEMAFTGNCGINVNLEFDQGGMEQAP